MKKGEIHIVPVKQTTYREDKRLKKDSRDNPFP